MVKLVKLNLSLNYIIGGLYSVRQLGLASVSDSES